MGTSHVTLDEAAILTVGEVMISRPKTLPSTATVADARRLFENPSVRTPSWSKTAATPAS